MSSPSSFSNKIIVFTAVFVSLFFSFKSGAEVSDFPVFSVPDSELEIKILTISVKQGAIVASCGDRARLVRKEDEICAGYSLTSVGRDAVILLGDHSRGERVYIHRYVEDREGQVLVMYAKY
jgi:hypothetical protein